MVFDLPVKEENYLLMLTIYSVSRLHINYDKFNKLYSQHDGTTLHYASVVRDYADEVFDCRAFEKRCATIFLEEIN